MASYFYALPVTRPGCQIRFIPEKRLSKIGFLRSYRETCGPRDPNKSNSEQEWECTRESLGGVNPQAPHGRWMPESRSEVTPLRHAFAVVTAQEPGSRSTGDRTSLNGNGLTGTAWPHTFWIALTLLACRQQARLALWALSKVPTAVSLPISSLLLTSSRPSSGRRPRT